MPLNFVDKSIWNAATNLINNTNVATIGELNTVIQALAGAGFAPLYGSQQDLGKRMCLPEFDLVPQASSKYLLSTGTAEFGGIYQAIQVDSGATAANVAAGKAAFVLETATGGAAGSGALGYVVTDEAHALALTLLGGVFLNSITPGNFGFVQVHGKANVLYNAAVTDPGVVGDSVVVKGAGDGTFDALALATATTNLTMGKNIGYALVGAVAGQLKTVQMTRLIGRY